MANNKLEAKGEELTKAASQSSPGMPVSGAGRLPSALKMLDDSIQWTTDLGNAFLNQQPDVMDAIESKPILRSGLQTQK